MSQRHFAAFLDFYRQTSFEYIMEQPLITHSAVLMDIFPKEYPATELFLPLPVPEMGEKNLFRVFQERRSIYPLEGQMPTKAALAELLYWSVGVTGYKSLYGYRNFPLRAFPSAGGLQATEVYVGLPAKVEDLPVGVYHYHPLKHGLEKVGGREQVKMMAKSVYDFQPWPRTHCLFLLLTVDYTRLEHKYGGFAGRLSMLDPGFAAQNIYLAATALGLKTTVIGGFHAGLAAASIGLEEFRDLATGHFEFPLLIFPVGALLADEQ